jgi:hypothetical protein
MGISAVISSGCSSACRSSSDAYRHSATYGCPAIHPAAIDATVVNADAADAYAANSNRSSIREGIS